MAGKATHAGTGSDGGGVRLGDLGRRAGAWVRDVLNALLPGAAPEPELVPVPVRPGRIPGAGGSSR